MVQLRVGGVPEHFNIPWMYALEKKWFEQSGIDLTWTDYPGGTGALNQDLRENILDIAVVLTEGCVADIIKGNPSKIIQWHVTSPLVWGIYTGANSSINESEDFAGKKYAISRFGSGSHLMAYVDASQRGYTLEEQQFVLVQNLAGATKALPEGTADLFMWEKFMTKPLVDNGTFRKVGECPTPWPSFVIAVREAVLEKYLNEISLVLSILQKSCAEFYALPDAAQKIATRYGLKQEDANEWMKAIQWQTSTDFDSSPIQAVINTLESLKLIPTTKSVKEICTLI